nr:arsinothricin resistance N-acetyltransferase ArsN1 family B [Massilia glaciei]
MLSIRNATGGDAAAIAAIYNHYVLQTPISFEEQAVADDDMAQRVAGVQEKGLPWIVWETNGVIVGYAYATPWRVRHAYRFSVETSVYLMHGKAGQGMGAHLYRTLLARLAEGGYRLAIGGIALPNEASIALHEKMGYQKAAHFKGVGFKFDRWIDVGYWQIALGEAGAASPPAA